MPTLYKNSLAVYDSLSIVRIEGFEAPGDVVEGYKASQTINGGVDEVGSANAFVEAYGFLGLPDPQVAGILWTDYAGDGSIFSILIDSTEVDAIRVKAEELGYTVVSAKEVDAPIRYGDDETVIILGHPDGWVVAV